MEFGYFMQIMYSYYNDKMSGNIDYSFYDDKPAEYDLIISENKRVLFLYKFVISAMRSNFNGIPFSSAAVAESVYFNKRSIPEETALKVLDNFDEHRCIQVLKRVNENEARKIDLKNTFGMNAYIDDEFFRQLCHIFRDYFYHAINSSSSRLYHLGSLQKNIKSKQNSLYEGEYIVGIGAINYDFMFIRSNEGDSSIPGGGFEGLLNGDETTKDTILAFKQDEKLECFTQLGGAAFNAIREIHKIRGDSTFLKLAYVGIIGKMPEEITEAFSPNEYDKHIKDELNFLDIKDWLFSLDENIGLACFELYGGHRRGGIGQGVNIKLLSEVKRKLKSSSNARNEFLIFLSKARWLHISSLVEDSQFMMFIDVIEQAKTINPALKISFDPGRDYMERKNSELRKMFYLSDYVFLSKTMYKAPSIKRIFNKHDRSNATIIVMESPYKTNWIKLTEGDEEAEQTFELDPVEQNKIIINDTSSIGSFAGSFIFAELGNHDTDIKHSICIATKTALESMTKPSNDLFPVEIRGKLNT